MGFKDKLKKIKSVRGLMLASNRTMLLSLLFMFYSCFNHRTCVLFGFQKQIEKKLNLCGGWCSRRMEQCFFRFFFMFYSCSSIYKIEHFTLKRCYCNVTDWFFVLYWYILLPILALQAVFFFCPSKRRSSYLLHTYKASTHVL